MDSRPGIGVYSSCKSKLIRRCVKPDLRAGETDNLPPLGESIVRLRLASIHRIRFAKAEKYTHPRGRKDRNIREKKQFWVMEDALTLVLVIVLCLLLKPLISAILRGLGSSEHRRDR